MRVGGDAASRLHFLTAALDAAQEALTISALASGLFAWSPAALAFLCGGVVPLLFEASRSSFAAYSTLLRVTPDRRYLEYLKWLAVDSAAAKEIRCLDLVAELRCRFDALAARVFEEVRALGVARAARGTILGSVSTAFYYGAFVSVARQALSGTISIGTFVFLIGSFARAQASMVKIAMSANQLTEHALLLGDFNQLLSLKSERATRPEFPRATVRRQAHSIVFENVQFTYPDSCSPTLKGITFSINRGETVAIVGANGSGKSTIVKLLLRLYEPSHGRILLDGTDLRDYDVKDVRRCIGVLFQDFMRYDFTAIDNIAVAGSRNADEVLSVEEAARWSGAADFVERLPGGYGQLLGRRFAGGMELSGGQWQRLALARAYYSGAQTLVLDEPTASVDSRQTAAFLRQPGRHRTTVIITHDIKCASMADKVIVLAGGVVAESGTHEVLVRSRGDYMTLFQPELNGERCA